MTPHASLFESPKAKLGAFAILVAVLDWASRMQTVMSLLTRIPEIWASAWFPSTLLILGIGLLFWTHFEPPSEGERQWHSLNLIEKIALRLCTVRGGITDNQLAEYLESNGLPKRTDVFSGIAARTSLLGRDYTTGQWTVKTSFADDIKRLSRLLI